MDKDRSHLTLVDSNAQSSQAEEFAPLPFYPWEERPVHLPLDHDECATAIHLSNGDLQAAAALLKVPLFRLNRNVRNSPRLQRVKEEALENIVHKAASHVIDSLNATNEAGDPDHKRREWAASKILSSKAAQSNPLSPAPAGSAVASSLTVNPVQKTVTFRWRDDEDTPGQLLENE